MCVVMECSNIYSVYVYTHFNLWQCEYVCVYFVGINVVYARAHNHSWTWFFFSFECCRWNSKDQKQIKQNEWIEKMMNAKREIRRSLICVYASIWMQSNGKYRSLSWKMVWNLCMVSIWTWFQEVMLCIFCS